MTPESRSNKQMEDFTGYATPRQSAIIYSTVLIGVIGFFGALPFIRTQVSTQAPGMLRPLAEKTEIHPLVAGTITQLRAHENQTVRKGDTLLVLQSGAMQAQLALNAKQQTQKAAFAKDLEALTRGGSPAGGPHTQLYSH